MAEIPKGLVDREYERDSAGNCVHRVVEIPYHPEYIKHVHHFDANGKEWRDTRWIAGNLLAYRFELGDFLAETHGFESVDVAKVELPTLDYNDPKPLFMKVHVRVPKRT